MIKGTLTLANAQIVAEGKVSPGAVHVENGVIAAVTPGSQVPKGAVDCDGDYLIPGLIELHTDNLERHIQPRPQVDWPHDAAILAHDAELASVGITTVFDAMRVGSNLSGGGVKYAEYARSLTDELLALQRAEALKIGHFIHLRAEVCSDNLVCELDSFGIKDRVRIVSLMDHTPGQRQFRDLDKFKAFVARKNGLTEEEIDAEVARRFAMRDTYGDLHEKATVRAAQRLNATLASHDDTTVDQVAVSAKNGTGIAEFPTSVEAALACREAGIAIMMGAPNLIRGKSHSGNIAAAELADRDLLDIVSSDYVPAALLLSAFRLAALWQDLPRAIATVTQAPARATGLTDRGRIAPELIGDLLRVRAATNTPIVRGVWKRGQQVA